MGSEPTEIWKDGTQVWKNENGELHREDGPAIIFPDGIQHWFINGNFHREDGPAVIYPDGRQYWYINGNPHREDGPAAIGSGIVTGKQYWCINGHVVTDQIREWAKDRDIDLNNLTEMDKMIIKLECFLF